MPPASSKDTGFLAASIQLLLLVINESFACWSLNIPFIDRSLKTLSIWLVFNQYYYYLTNKSENTNLSQNIPLGGSLRQQKLTALMSSFKYIKTVTNLFSHLQPNNVTVEIPGKLRCSCSGAWDTGGSFHKGIRGPIEGSVAAVAMNSITQLLGVFLREMNQETQKAFCTEIFIASLSVIAHDRKVKCSTAEG